MLSSFHLLLLGHIGQAARQMPSEMVVHARAQAVTAHAAAFGETLLTTGHIIDSWGRLSSAPNLLLLQASDAAMLLFVSLMRTSRNGVHYTIALRLHFKFVRESISSQSPRPTRRRGHERMVRCSGPSM